MASLSHPASNHIEHIGAWSNNQRPRGPDEQGEFGWFYQWGSLQGGIDYENVPGCPFRLFLQPDFPFARALCWQLFTQPFIQGTVIDCDVFVTDHHMGHCIERRRDPAAAVGNDAFVARFVLEKKCELIVWEK